MRNAPDDRVGRSIAITSAIGRSVTTLLADMERELRIMAADLLDPTLPGEHRPQLRRTRRPGFRPGD